jgi:hypothetical protein
MFKTSLVLEQEKFNQMENKPLRTFIKKHLIKTKMKTILTKEGKIKLQEELNFLLTVEKIKAITELSDARERLKHYFNHYNHFRPHQGIDGMTPADRFFGVESEVRKVIEDSVEKNSLRMALDEAPRTPVFLVGNIGGKTVSLHGEGGELVFQSNEGVISKIKSNEFGFSSLIGDGHGARDQKTEERKDNEEEKTIDDGQTSIADQVALENSERGRKEDSSPSRHDSARILDGTNQQVPSCQTAEHTPYTPLADISAGVERDVGGFVEATNHEEERYEGSHRARHKATIEEDSGTREDNSHAGSLDRDLEGDAWVQASESGEDGGEESWKEKEDTTTSSKERSLFGFWKREEK